MYVREFENFINSRRKLLPKEIYEEILDLKDPNSLLGLANHASTITKITKRF